MPVKFFGTQKFVYNLDSRIGKTVIVEPFMKAGKILGWADSSPGLGFNKEMLNFIIRMRLRFVVLVESEDKEYWITHQVLYDFIKNNNTDYKVGWDRWLNVISWKKFTRFMPKSET